MFLRKKFSADQSGGPTRSKGRFLDLVENCPNFQNPKIQIGGDRKSSLRNPAMEVGDVFPRTCPDWWWYYE